MYLEMMTVSIHNSELQVPMHVVCFILDLEPLAGHYTGGLTEEKSTSFQVLVDISHFSMLSINLGIRKEMD